MENYKPLDMSKISRIGATNVDLTVVANSLPARIQESSSFRPQHLNEQRNGYLIDYPIDAGTNIIISNNEGVPALVLAMFEYDGVPTVHMIQRAKKKKRDEQGFVIESKELEQYKQQALNSAIEIARKNGKHYIQVVSGFRNLWAHDPDGEIPLSVLLATYDKGMAQLGYKMINQDGSEINKQSAEEIVRLIKRILNGDKNLSWQTIQSTLGNFYFWRTRT